MCKVKYWWSVLTLSCQFKPKAQFLPKMKEIYWFKSRHDEGWNVPLVQKAQTVQASFRPGPNVCPKWSNCIWINTGVNSLMILKCFYYFIFRDDLDSVYPFVSLNAIPPDPRCDPSAEFLPERLEVEKTVAGWLKIIQKPSLGIFVCLLCVFVLLTKCFT